MIKVVTDVTDFIYQCEICNCEYTGNTREEAKNAALKCETTPTFDGDYSGLILFHWQSNSTNYFRIHLPQSDYSGHHFRWHSLVEFDESRVKTGQPITKEDLKYYIADAGGIRGYLETRKFTRISLETLSTIVKLMDPGFVKMAREHGVRSFK